MKNVKFLIIYREAITHERASDGLVVLLIKATESVGCTLATVVRLAPALHVICALFRYNSKYDQSSTNIVFCPFP